MENDRSDQPQRVRLPGYEEQAADRSAYTWHAQPSWPPTYPRDYGARHTRRVSNWTAAALIAAVAATTGYLAHAIPGTSAGTGTSRHAKPPAVVPIQPAVQAPVVTSGGSGGHGGGGDN